MGNELKNLFWNEIHIFILALLQNLNGEVPHIAELSILSHSNADHYV